MDPTGLDSSVTTTHTLTDVAAGSYSVSVMAVNENGMSRDETVSFVVEGMRDVDEPAVLYIQVFGHCCVCVCVRSTYTHTRSTYMCVRVCVRVRVCTSCRLKQP